MQPTLILPRFSVFNTQTYAVKRALNMSSFPRSLALKSGSTFVFCQSLSSQALCKAASCMRSLQLPPWHGLSLKTREMDQGPPLADPASFFRAH